MSATAVAAAIIIESTRIPQRSEDAFTHQERIARIRYAEQNRSMVDRHARSEARGGTRRGAGRPAGGGRYGEPTVTVRIPVSLPEKVSALASTEGRKLPLHRKTA